MDQGLDYLQRIHRSVIRAAENKGSDDPMQICRQALKELGLPETMANPLVCRSFMSSLTAKGINLWEIEKENRGSLEIRLS